MLGEVWPSLAALEGDKHVYHKVQLDQWLRFFLRLRVRNEWHWRGLWLCLLRRPHLRSLPPPHPGTETVAKYLRQPRVPKTAAKWVDAQVLVDLVDLRNKMGMEFSFLEDDVVLRALEIARSRSGIMTRIRKAAKDEQKQATPVTSASASSFGPRGGLPRTKAALQAVLRSIGLSDEGTVGELRERIKEHMAGIPKTAAASRREAAKPPQKTSGQMPTEGQNRPPSAAQRGSDGSGPSAASVASTSGSGPGGDLNRLVSHLEGMFTKGLAEMEQRMEARMDQMFGEVLFQSDGMDTIEETYAFPDNAEFFRMDQ